MNVARGRHRAAADDGVAPLPVGDAASRAFDDGDERHEIPGVEDGVGHDVCSATGNEVVAMAIAPVVIARDAATQVGKGVAILIFVDAPMRRCQQDSFLDAGTAADVYRAVVERGLHAIADEKVVKNGLIDDAENWFAMLEQRDERAKEIAVGDKALGAVNGVKHPLIGGIGLMIAVLFAHDAVVGIGRHNRCAHGFFGLGVSNGDGGEVGFQFNLNVAAIVWLDDLGAEVG